MTNYQVVRVSDKTKEPIYTNKDEHGLDAMMFALYAFIEEYPDFVNTIYSTEMAKQANVMKQIHHDPLANLIQHRLDSRAQTTGWDEPGPPPPKKTRVGARKASKEDGLGWGRRGQSASRASGIKRRF